MTEETSLARVAFLRSVANRLSEVINAIATKPEEGVTAARELLEDLCKSLPRESLAELDSMELNGISGCLVEVKDRLDLGIFLKEDNDNRLRRGLVLMSGTKTIESILLSTIYPRWELPALFPENGIPRETTRDNYQPSTVHTEQATEPTKDTKPETPSAPGNEELVAISEAEFKALPNKSLVSVTDKETGKEVVGTRTRKGRWAIDSASRPMNDAEAWELLADTSEDGEVYVISVGQ